MKTYTDQMGHSITLEKTPQRIVSLVPSQTELLIDLGCVNQLIGRTQFCIHPNDKVKSIEKIGGTKKLKWEKLIALQPDLIIGNKEENTKQDIEKLSALFPVWMSDIRDLTDAENMILELGKITGKEENAKQICLDINQKKESKPPIKREINCLYIIWRDPWMVAGCDTFINTMLQYIGCKNVCTPGSRYPILDAKQIKDLSPEVVFLSSEPYPFKKKHIQEIESILPGSMIQLVNGEYFSWYGSRLLHAFDALHTIREQIEISTG